MRRIAIVAAVLAASVPAAPARGVPPVTVAGEGGVAPGFYPTPTPVWPNAVAFNGTATDPAGATYGCEILGTGTNYAPGTLTGFAEIDCGPAVASLCPFTMTATSWSLACPGGGTLAVTFSSPTYFTSFTASGVLT